MPLRLVRDDMRRQLDLDQAVGDPEWRSPNWIMPEECAHLTKVIMRELDARGFQIVKKPS
jgi:hypothetical protein